jgi:hypothetical protein
MTELIIGFAIGVVQQMLRQSVEQNGGQNQKGGQKRKRTDSSSDVKRKRRPQPEQRRCACVGCERCEKGDDGKCLRLRNARRLNCNSCYRENLRRRRQEESKLIDWVDNDMDYLEDDFDENFLDSVGDWIPIKHGGNRKTQSSSKAQITDVLRPEGSDITKNITQFLNPYAESQLQGHNILPDERNATCAQLVTAINKNEWDKVKYLILAKKCITKRTSKKILDTHPLLRAYHIAKYAPYPPPICDELHTKYSDWLKDKDAESLIKLDFLSEHSGEIKKMVLSLSFERGILYQKYVQWLNDNKIIYDEKSILGGFAQDQLKWIILIEFIIDNLEPTDSL